MTTDTSDCPRVFVTQEQPHINYCKAEDFGSIVFVSVHDVPTVRTSVRVKESIQAIKQNMRGYRAGIDMILPSGSPVNIACAMMLAGKSGHTHKLLKWENRAQRYDVVTLEL